MLPRLSGHLWLAAASQPHHWSKPGWLPCTSSKTLVTALDVMQVCGSPADESDIREAADKPGRMVIRQGLCGPNLLNLAGPISRCGGGMERHPACLACDLQHPGLWRPASGQTRYAEHIANKMEDSSFGVVVLLRACTMGIAHALSDPGNDTLDQSLKLSQDS